MSEAVETPKPMKKALWGARLSSLFGLALALACLRQWGSPHPWSRLDLYSGSFLGLSVLMAVVQAWTFLRSAFRSKEVAREALGMSYDPTLLRWATLLSFAELTVVLDYAHWHLVPALERHTLQNIGLGLCVLAAAWLIWTDIWLGRHFSSDAVAGQLMTGGPFRLVRHPRYAGFLTNRVGLPLVFASPLGWASLLCWILLILRRIRREEAHLGELFGASYDAYALRTARLLSGIF